MYTLPMTSEQLDPIYGVVEDKIAEIQEQIIGLQRALIEVKVSFISQIIYFNSFTTFNFPQNIRDNLTNELNSTLSHLRGRLSEGAIPEDAFEDWRKDIRKRLSHIFTSQQVDSLIPSSSEWLNLLGVQGTEEE